MILETQIFLGALLEGVAYLDFWSKKEKAEQESTRGHQDQQLHHIFLQVPCCMYVSFTSFGMYGTCMWFLGCDLSLTWRIAQINNGLPSLSISQIAMVIVGLLSLFFLVGSHVSLVWVKLLVPRALVGQMLWRPVIAWVQLLVLEPWLDKHSGAQGQLQVELLVLEPWLEQTLWSPGWLGQRLIG